MKKWLVLFLCICMAFSLASCGGREKGQVSGSQEQTSASGQTQTEQPDAVQPESEQPNADGQNKDSTQTSVSDSRVLIAYFTWADNTQVEDKDAAIESALSHYESVGDRGNYDGVDATTSASVLPPGNAAKIAGWIQERTGGDLFSIIVEEPYSSDYDECLDRAADEKAENARPALVSHVENMDQYDTVFLGFPNWWYTVPMAIHSFLEEYDFKGKTVIPFVTHGTGGLASTIQDITADLPDSEILEPIGVYRPEVDSSKPAVDAWLESLGFEEGGDEPEMENKERKLKMVIEGQEIGITLYDTSAANDLYNMLPLELTFEDFNSVEKISYLEQSLTTEGEPDGCDPDVGDLCLYEPWGNLSIFYQDFRYSERLIMLGHIDSGMDIISGMTDDFSATLEKAD